MFKKSLIVSVIFHLLLCAGLELVPDHPDHLPAAQQQPALIMVAFDADIPWKATVFSKSNDENDGHEKNFSPPDKSLLKDQGEQATDLSMAEETPPSLLTDNDKVNAETAMSEPDKSRVSAEDIQSADLQGITITDGEPISGVGSSPEVGYPDRLPVKLRHRTPKYPLIARHNNWEGVTVLTIQVQPDGAVGEIDISQTSGFQVLDQAAVKAVKQWRYQPAVKNGLAIAWQIRVKIIFKLE
jgi:TonB family protein